MFSAFKSANVVNYYKTKQFRDGQEDQIRQGAKEFEEYLFFNKA